MGQAKSRRAANKAILEALKAADIARVAGAIRRLCAAASERLGGDCYVHAHLAQSLLQRLGVPSELVVGEAAWRVGPREQDVVSHLYSGFEQAPAVGYHAWLQIADQIFDPTTYQLSAKALLLDIQDGGRTRVEWAPEFLLLPLKINHKFESVVACRQPGAFYYKRLADLEQYVKSTFIPDPADSEMAWLCYQAAEATVLGPNHFTDPRT